MKYAYLLLLAGCLFSCKKKDASSENTVYATTKWEAVPGQYYVYDKLGTFLYEMQITCQDGPGTRTFTYFNFDVDYIISCPQNTLTPFTNDISLGNTSGFVDLNGNRFDLYDLGCFAHNIQNNDTITFRFQKTNGLYAEEDDTVAYSENLFHIAVKQ
jgi:hypothetical protein